MVVFVTDVGVVVAVLLESPMSVVSWVEKWSPTSTLVPKSCILEVVAKELEVAPLDDC